MFELVVVFCNCPVPWSLQGKPLQVQLLKNGFSNSPNLCFRRAINSSLQTLKALKSSELNFLNCSYLNNPSLALLRYRKQHGIKPLRMCVSHVLSNQWNIQFQRATICDKKLCQICRKRGEIGEIHHQLVCPLNNRCTLTPSAQIFLQSILGDSFNLENAKDPGY